MGATAALTPFANSEKSMIRYKVVKVIGHPIAAKNGTVLEHRKVWFDHYGFIEKGHVIHHINGDKHDNRIENLESMTRSQHMKEHYQEGLGVRNGEIEYVTLQCAVCGTSYSRKLCVVKSNSGNINIKHNIHSCSRKCWAVVANAYKWGKVDQLLQRKLKETP